MDEREIAALYRTWGPTIYRRCLRLLRDQADAADAVQEVFLKLLSGMGRYDERGRVLNLIYRIATNHCLNMLRDRRTVLLAMEKAAIDSREFGGAPGAALSPDPAYVDPAHVLECRDAVLSVLAGLDDQTAAMLYMREVDRMGVEEIADVRGVSRKTVHRKLSRLRLVPPT